MSTQQNARKVLNDSIISEISAAVASLDFGEVTIKIHDKKILQIEIAEKKRFDDVWKLEEGGGI
ncbi:MAG TPA: YezD family protein [Candidatus Omnitrophota bacterium]|nr:YezD family protein [Candidatus Omnitrophota bacterium]HPT08032.1 YezD family protein [Candidatus Omnitrophota bacterium]